MNSEGLRRCKIKCPGKGLATAFLLLIAFFGSAFAQESGHAADREHIENNGQKNQAAATNFALVPVHLYQKYLSPVIGGRCPMSPSCSGYARQAIEKHGAAMGWIMACDRLMRCGRDEVKQAPVVHEGPSSFCYDPVKNNDFWLK